MLEKKTFNFLTKTQKACKSNTFFLDSLMQGSGPPLILNSLLKQDRKTDCWSHFLQVCPNLERRNPCYEGSNLTTPDLPEGRNRIPRISFASKPRVTSS